MLSLYAQKVIEKIDSVFVPSPHDWEEALEHKRALERQGYRLDLCYPFDETYLKMGFNDVYEYYLEQV